MTYYEVKKVTQVILQAIVSTLSQFPSIVVRESMMQKVLSNPIACAHVVSSNSDFCKGGVAQG
jgi:hypothetical protein